MGESLLPESNCAISVHLKRILTPSPVKSIVSMVGEISFFTPTFLVPAYDVYATN